MNRTTLPRAIAAALFGSAVVFGAGPIAADTHGERGRQTHAEQEGHAHGMRGPRQPMTEAEREQFRARIQARVNERLDRLGTKLGVNASQQEAWHAYRKARTSMFETRRAARPAENADAATLARFRAERAQQRAQHLATVADATARLYQVLDGNQRKVLDETARQRGRHGMRAQGPRQRAETADTESAV